MPRNSSQWIAHRIAGGWATDYGNTFYGAPQGGSLEIPWCTTCENIKFQPNGSFGKYPGLYQIGNRPINSPVSPAGTAASSNVHHLFNYTRSGGTLSEISQLIAIIGAYVYIIDTVESTRIGYTISAAGVRTYMSTFNDLLVIGGLTPRSWDQTTFQTLAGTPPSFQFSTPHAGRHWAAGDPSSPSRLYYSVVGNPEDWVGSGSGSIDIDPGDGDSIVALLSWKRELWVFKGPNRLSIHRITGTTPSDFSRVPFIYGVSAAGQGSLFQVGDDFGFWSPRGSCHSLTSTNQYGDYSQSYINYPVLSWFRNSDNIAGGISSSTWQVVTDTLQDITYCVFNNNPDHSGSYDVAFMMDWRFRSETNPYPRFIPLKLKRPFSAVTLAYDVFNTTQLRPFFGDARGRIYQEYPPSFVQYNVRRDDTYDGVEYRVETPALTYGPSVYQKTITGVSINVRDDFNTSSGEYGELDFSYSGRGIPSQTLTFPNTLGSKLGSFTLGTDQLGGIHDAFHYADEVQGEGKAFTYTLVEDTPLSLINFGTNVVVDHFSVLYTPSGESQENG